MIQPLAITPDFMPRSAQDPQLAGGRLLSFFAPDRPDDVHPEFWEMHPEGDELLLLCSGALDIEFEVPEEQGQSACHPGPA